MGRQPEPEKAANHERWLVSFADFMTLLFALFVTMYANSMNDEGPSPKEYSEGIVRAFRSWGPYVMSGSAPEAFTLDSSAEESGGSVDDAGPGGEDPVSETEDDPWLERQPSQPTPTPTPTGKGGEEEENRDFRRIYEGLKTRLAEEETSGTIEISKQKRGIVISLGEAGFFDSGSADVRANSFHTIRTIAQELRKMREQRKDDLAIRIEGHTDNVPLRSGSRFVDNRGLSCFRAISVLDLLEKRFGFPAASLSPMGYADTRPKAGNDTPAGRARNRRVDIVVLNAEYAGLESSGSDVEEK